MAQTAGVGAVAGGAEGKALPYPPSWVDRLTDWIARLPLPAWLFYLVLFVVAVLLQAAVKWADGSYRVGTFLPFHVMTDLTPIASLALIHYLDDRAGEALATFRPAMIIEDDEYERLRYEITTLPARPTLIASVIGGAYGIFGVWLVSSEYIAQYKLLTSPPASVVDITLSGLSYMMVATVFYHVIHQLRLVNRIYIKHTRVDLFHLRPLYAFSNLAARTAVIIGAVLYAWIYILSPTGTLEPFLYLVVPVATFLLPLLGIHGMLQKEKWRLKDENARHLEAAIGDLHQQREAGEYGHADALNKFLDSLIKEQGLLDKIPTWPWQPETLRWFGTALLLPVILALLSRALQKFLGF